MVNNNLVIDMAADMAVIIITIQETLTMGEVSLITVGVVADKLFQSFYVNNEKPDILNK